LDAPSSIAIGSGQLWVTDPASNVVEAFDSGDHGDALPAETIHGWRTKLHHPIAVAVDNGFGQISVLNQPSGGAPSLTSYVPFFRLPIEFGNLAPIANVTGGPGTPLPAPTAIASSTLDGSVWVTDASTHSAQEVELFGPNMYVLGRIKGADTGLNDPTGVAIDALGRPVITESSSHSVLVFDANAHGDASPTITITGVGTDAGSPAAVAVNGAAPSPPIGVQAHVHGDRATVHWSAPAASGGGIAGYELEMIVVSRTQFGVHISEVNFDGGGLSTKTTARFRHLPTKGSIRFFVTAMNDFGLSPAARSNPIRAYSRPGAPTDVVAIAAGGKMTVGWQTPAQTGGKPITHYRVEYGTCTPGAKGCHYHTVTVRGSQHRVRISGLATARTYRVRVLAQSRIGISKPSTTVKVRT
jgi:hypothetical protein